jgi:hypothetical protein
MDEWVKKPILSIYGFIFINFFRLYCPRQVSISAQGLGRMPGINHTQTPGGEKGDLQAINFWEVNGKKRINFY